jgi:hypothetical protein
LHNISILIRKNAKRLLVLTLSPAMFLVVGHGARVHKHASEAAIAAMTPAQRVDEWVNEQVHHRYDVLDPQADLLRKYILLDGVKALPRLVEIMSEFESPRRTTNTGTVGERFDASLLLFIFLDRQAIRLRASDDGKRGMELLERIIKTMRTNGAERTEAEEWKWIPHGRFELAVAYLKETRGLNDTDQIIRNTFYARMNIELSDAELLDFSNFLIKHNPAYPSWSEKEFVKVTDKEGKRLPGLLVKNIEPYYQSLLQFKSTR